MSGQHAHALYVHGHSPLHRMAPECKLAAHVLFVMAVVATPREALWAFGAYALILVGLIALAGIPPLFVARRLAIEIPFVLFAVLLPFVGPAPRTEVFGTSLSIEGLWGMWNVLAKATIGLAASVLVAATTTMPEFLRGFERLRFPRVFTAVASFMIRYLDVIADEMRRMKIARASRGYDPRWLWQARAVAAGAGALFVRSYERGERVYTAMQSRGYAGSMPQISHEAPASRNDWAVGLGVAATAGLICSAAWLVGR